jgi:hypothetical protein
MASLIWLMGLLTAGLGGWVVWRPKPLIRMLQWAQNEILFSILFVAKAACGVIMLVWARSCCHPAVIILIGILAVAGSVVVIVAPRSRTQKLIQWFLNRPQWLHRMWGIVALAAGILIVWAGWLK